MSNTTPLQKRDYYIIIIFVCIYTYTYLWYEIKEPSFPQISQGIIATHVSLEDFPYKQPLSFHPSQDSKNYSAVWGEENIQKHGNNLLISFPAGSHAPSGSIIGGAGFVYTIPKMKSKHSILHYTLHFSEDFNFVKGGKLPGLCGGDCPRGGNKSQYGFSTRFMWRRDGQLETYAYTPDSDSAFGVSIGRGMYTFSPGNTYKLSQEIKINDTGKSNGILRVYVNGEMVYEKTDMLYQVQEEVYANMILFSTFFGGGDKSWATPIQSEILFSDFEVWWK